MSLKCQGCHESVPSAAYLPKQERCVDVPERDIAATFPCPFKFLQVSWPKTPENSCKQT
jgi:hypothetical protein